MNEAGGRNALPAKGDDAALPELPALPGTPDPPKPTIFAVEDRQGVLVSNVENALRALPGYFASETNIEGIEAGDLFSLNSVLGGAIEIQVVQTLNKIRSVWDPGDEWTDYRFERRSQSFPDVRLIRRRGAGVETAMGIELKGWYLLSKEMEPSFRYTVTPAACAPYDLLVIVPWHLKNVLSGAPVVREPFIAGARFAALYRNYWWEFVRGARGAKGVVTPAGTVTPYPESKSGTNDSAEYDQGGNFGRVARIGDLTDEYTKNALTERIAGIEARSWITFFKSFTDASDPETVWRRLEEKLQTELAARNNDDAGRIRELIEELTAVVRPGTRP